MNENRESLSSRRALSWPTWLAITSMVLLVLATAVSCVSSTGGAKMSSKASSTAASQKPKGPVGTLSLPISSTSAHDPSMGKDGKTYYVYLTGAGIPIKSSTDLINWTNQGSVFPVMPSWAANEVGVSVTDAMWAPDVSYYKGVYRLYYAVSTFGSNHSVIGLATNKTLDVNSPDYKWVDQGKVIESVPSDFWNAIDPNFVVDQEGQPWLDFGSFWGGIKLVKLDLKTGKPTSDHPDIIDIASRPEPPDAIEGAYIIYRDGYYYLFASFDFCCRAVDSTYNVRVGRSKKITGPYVDESGNDMLSGGGTRILSGTDRWKGPGGESIFHDTDGKWWMVYHTYDANLGGAPVLHINQIHWTKAGWPEKLSPIEEGQK